MSSPLFSGRGKCSTPRFSREGQLSVGECPTLCNGTQYMSYNGGEKLLDGSPDRLYIYLYIYI